MLSVTVYCALFGDTDAGVIPSLNMQICTDLVCVYVFRVNVDENVVMELSKSALEFNSKFINQHQFTSWLSKFITPEFSEKLMEVYTLV